ncbi:M56 family metallopeptidase [Paenibacillus camerounensis]|uniref:M56 family metallopeptidase n=1 Tax=Paenibacillus camerounensis TaxID=1243663 RepID=UPI0005A9ADB8|nr:M56 family metallopeptidase [Paenibacillus camerounensis]
MRSSNLHLPQQTKRALFTLLTAVLVVITMLLYNIMHQLQDVQANDDLLKWTLMILTDSLNNHIVWELILNGLIIFSLAVLLKISYQEVKARSIWKKYVNSRREELNHSVITSFAQRKIRFIILNEPEMTAMTVGFFRPTIVLSTALIERFNEQELEAIICHEYYHYKSFHPLQLFMMHLTADALAFLPVIKQVFRHYQIWMELLADRYAIKRMGNEIPIAQVLLTMTRNNVSNASLHRAYFANEAINYRLVQLIEPDQKLDIPLFDWKPMILSTTILLLILFIFVYYCI